LELYIALKTDLH